MPPAPAPASAHCSSAPSLTGRMRDSSRSPAQQRSPLKRCLGSLFPREESLPLGLRHHTTQLHYLFVYQCDRNLKCAIAAKGEYHNSEEVIHFQTDWRSKPECYRSGPRENQGDSTCQCTALYGNTSCSPPRIGLCRLFGARPDPSILHPNWQDFLQFAFPVHKERKPKCPEIIAIEHKVRGPVAPFKFPPQHFR